MLTWIPTGAQGPSTNPVVVRVFDNGTPSLSATQAFTARVYLPPSLGGSGIGGNQFRLTWFAPSGQTYQVEFKDALDAPSWAPFGGPLTAGGAALSVTNDLANSPQRFFRVKVLP